jgi:guanylate kinase
MSGSLFIVAAPSGAGKSSLVKALLERDSGLHLSVSYSTRAPRAGEVDGVNYHFVSREVFFGMRERGEFLESAEVHGNFYGTSKPWIEQQMRAGRDIVLEIDCQGAEQVKRIFASAVAVFILPPSMAELERRLRGRGTDSEQVIAARMQAAGHELRQAVQFDYAIINSDFSEALAQLSAVVTAARLRVAQQGEREAKLFGDLGIKL